MGLGSHGDPPMAWIRLLDEKKGTSFDTLSSPSFIAWYCFLAFCVALVCVCCCWLLVRRRLLHYQLERIMIMNEREESRQAERQDQISRIEANIKFFSDQQMIRRRSVLRRTLNGQRVVSLFNLCERTRVARGAKYLLTCIYSVHFSDH
jgi:hypothetical protein